MAEALYGVPSSNQVWRFWLSPSAARPGAVSLPRLRLPGPCPALFFAGAPPEAGGGRGRGSVQRSPSTRTARTPGSQPSARRRRGYQRLQQPTGYRRRGRHARPGAGCVPQYPALRRPLPCGTASLTAALSQATRGAAAARPPAGSRPAPARSKAATAVASELASAATGHQAWPASACPGPLASSMAPRPPHPLPVSVPCPRREGLGP